MRHVSETINKDLFDFDIDAQVADNYVYDEIGNLVKDRAEKIDTILWTVYGKIDSISKNGGATAIKYRYDGGGNRISKIVKVGSNITETWYVRDAQGNVLNVYSYNVSEGLNLAETHLYGSSRLGIMNRDINVSDGTGQEQISYTISSDVFWGKKYNFDRGNKLFETSNHLGNVLVAVSDRKKGYNNTSSPNVIAYYKADIRSASDYYAFGMQVPGRNFQAGSYRYGFNGKEMDNEVKGDGNQYDYGMRFYDPRLSRFLSVDPLAATFPYYSPFHYAGNSPIGNIDMDGGEPKDFRGRWIGKPLFDLSTKEMLSQNGGMSMLVSDPALGNIDVSLVYDKVTNKLWFVHQNYATGQWYYLNNKDGRNDELTLEGGTIQVKGGHFEPFETQNQVQARIGSQIADGIGVSAFVITAAITGGHAIQGLITSLSVANVTPLLEKSALAIYRNIPLLATTGRALLRFMDDTGAATQGMGNNGSRLTISFIRNLFQVSKTKNIAYIHGKIGEEVLEAIAVSGKGTISGTVGPGSSRFFKTIEVSFDRTWDSEAKVLEYLADKFKDNTQISGTIRLVSERVYCPSCDGVIKQFEKMFPNIKIEKVSGE